MSDASRTSPVMADPGLGGSVVNDVPDRQRRSFLLARGYGRLGIGLLLALLAFQGYHLLGLLPLTWARFLYLVPLGYAAAATLLLRPDCYSRPEWPAAVWWVRWSALLMAGLAPFWGWWQLLPDSRYCLVNTALFCLVGQLFLFQVVSSGRIVAEADGHPRLAWFCRITRLAVIYLLLAPALALILTVGYEQNSGLEVWYLLGRLSAWQQLILATPVMLTVAVCWRLSHALPVCPAESKDFSA